MQEAGYIRIVHHASCTVCRRWTLEDGRRSTEDGRRGRTTIPRPCIIRTPMSRLRSAPAPGPGPAAVSVYVSPCSCHRIPASLCSCHSPRARIAPLAHAPRHRDEGTGGPQGSGFDCSRRHRDADADKYARTRARGRVLTAFGQTRRMSGTRWRTGAAHTLLRASDSAARRSTFATRNSNFAVHGQILPPPLPLALRLPINAVNLQSELPLSTCTMD